MITETTSFISPDGKEYFFDTSSKFLLTEEGYGMPPIEFVTQRGPYQHGETLLDYSLQPRVVQLVARQTGCNRRELYSLRSALLDAVRPNRASILTPGKLRKRLPDGSVRDLTCIIQEGPAFGPRALDGWGEWSFQEAIRFIAHDPIWFDPTSVSLEAPMSGGLQFPITFPITFLDTKVYLHVSYTGTWLEYPTIKIDGPIQSARITNVTTDEVIQMTNSLGIGESMTINLAYSTKTVTKNDGTNLMGYVDTSSDLATFHLEPAPGASNGLNELEITGSSTNVNTKATITWYRRFIGL